MSETTETPTVPEEETEVERPETPDEASPEEEDGEPSAS